jgi:hypothetical protein
VILVDVNVLVYAARTDSPRHLEYRQWLDRTLNGESPFGVATLVLSGLVRVLTHPRVFDPPTPLAGAIEFADTLLAHPNSVRVGPGDRHWTIFKRLCEESDVKGNLVADAYLAALAIESGSEWITTDRDFSRFHGLHWRHPLKSA